MFSKFHEIFVLITSVFVIVSFLIEIIYTVAFFKYSYCYGKISYHTPKIDSSNLNIFSELNSLGGDIRTRHLTDGLQAEHG